MVDEYWIFVCSLFFFFELGNFIFFCGELENFLVEVGSTKKAMYFFF